MKVLANSILALSLEANQGKPFGYMNDRNGGGPKELDHCALEKEEHGGVQKTMSAESRSFRHASRMQGSERSWAAPPFNKSISVKLMRRLYFGAILIIHSWMSPRRTSPAKK